MIKKILFLMVTLGLGVYLIFFSEVFNVSFSQGQQDALIVMIKLYVIASLAAFVISELARNYSQVDRLWSTLPIAYTWYFAVQSGFNARMVIMAVLVTLWGIRLSLNFTRRGGFTLTPWKGLEDYRWEVIKRTTPILQNRLVWGIFNLLFICFYQMGIIFLFSLPILAAWQGANMPLGPVDCLLATLILLMIILETIADQQQYKYQKEKYRRINANEDPGDLYGTGFVHKGLWGISRHPNYFCEQSVWVLFYLFGAWASGQWINWSIGGIILLIILFRLSADFSEGISAGKYPEYKTYQKNVPMFFPLFKFPRRWK